MGISANQSKFIRALHQKKYRQKYNKFIVEGEKMVLECLRDQPKVLNEVFITENFKHPIPSSFQNLFYKIGEKDMEKITALHSPSPALAILNSFNYQLSDINLNSGKSLYLDGIKDPGNLGAIIRIGEWFGVNSIMLSLDCVDILNPKVVQSSMGSILRMPFIYLSQENLISTLDKLNTIIITASLEGENIYEAQIPENGVICIGSESHGVSDYIKKNSHLKLNIPAAKSNKGESLNAAVATGIILSLV
jgi:TrmH family RNA methyltransferase